MSDLERAMIGALNHRLKNGHQHHSACIHNLPPEEQIAMRGRSVEWWKAVIGRMPSQITPDEWEIDPPAFVGQMTEALNHQKEGRS